MEAQHEMTPANTRSGTRHLPPFIGSGLLSGLLYASGFLAVAFLVPIQFAFSREGKKEGFLSLLTSIAVIGIGNALRLSNLGVMGVAVLAQTLLPPAVLLAAIAVINIAGADGWTKLTLVAAGLAVVFGFMLSASIGTAEVQASIASMISQLLSSAGAQSVDVATIEQGYVGPAVTIIMNSFGAALWLVLAGSWWIGGRLGSIRTAAGAEEREKRAPAYAVPSWLLWPSMAAWGLLLIVLYGKMNGALAVVAWNVSLAAASWYAVQGFSVILHFLRTRGMQRLFGPVLAMLLAFMLLDPKVGFAIAILMPLLGVSEVWLQYRIRKGA